MALDRFIRWGKPPEWGAPTIERLASIAENFLGARWTVRVEGAWISCVGQEKETFALRTERDDKCADSGMTFGEGLHREMNKHQRGFEVFFLVETGEIKQTSVITRQGDEFTGALADRYAEIIARWFNGRVEVDGATVYDGDKQ